MSKLQAFVYKLVLEWTNPHLTTKGWVIVIASDRSVALAKGRHFAIEQASRESPGASVVREWLEPMIPFVISATGERSAANWIALASGEKANLIFCVAEPLVTRQRSSQPGAQVNALVAASNVEEAERVWNEFLKHEFFGLTASEICEDLPPIVVESAGESPA